MLAIPFNATALQALGSGPQTLDDLRRAAGAPPQTTMRGHLRSLLAAGVVRKRRGNQFAAAVSYELTDDGHGLLRVANCLAGWLTRSPEGSIQLGTSEAKSATKALVGAWSASVLRALASRPLSLTELDRVIAGLSYPSLERRLSSMRLLGMVEAMPGPGRSTPYTATDWLRRAVAPLAAAVRWEQCHRLAQAPPVTTRDIEAAFLLILPLLRLPEDISGSCRLAVRVDRNGERRDLVGVIAETKDGAVVSTITQLEGNPDASVHGPPSAWFAAVIERSARGLDLDGEPRLATSLVEELHAALLGDPSPRSP